MSPLKQAEILLMNFKLQQRALHCRNSWAESRKLCMWQSPEYRVCTFKVPNTCSTMLLEYTLKNILTCVWPYMKFFIALEHIRLMSVVEKFHRKWIHWGMKQLTHHHCKVFYVSGRVNAPTLCGQWFLVTTKVPFHYRNLGNVMGNFQKTFTYNGIYFRGEFLIFLRKKLPF